MPQLLLPMIALTGLYNNVPTLSPEEAGERVAQIAMNTSFRMFPDSTAAKSAKPGDKPVKRQLLPQALAMQQMMRGIRLKPFHCQACGRRESIVSGILYATMR